jgi:hypothetical protein
MGICSGRVVALACLALAPPALFAAVPGADNASDLLYGTGQWTTGMRGGYGLGPWVLIKDGSTIAFMAARSNNYPTLNHVATLPNGYAWAMQRSGGASNHAVAFRAFLDPPLSVGQPFSLDLEHGKFLSGGSCGFALRQGNATNSLASYLSGARFEWRAAASGNNYALVDGTSGGSAFDTGIPLTTNGLRFRLTLSDTNRYDLEVVRMATGTTNTFTGRALSGGAGIDSFAFRAFNVTNGQDGMVYFNSVSAGAKPPSPYAVAAVTVDGGGRRIGDEASLGLDASLSGGASGIAEAQAGWATVKLGYPAQLYDLAGLHVTAAPPAVAECGTARLSVADLFDDGTLGPAEGIPSWFIVQGPLTSVDAAGRVLASNVYQNTAGTAGAGLGSRTGTVAILVLNADPDNFGLYAGDTVPDDWQVRYFGPENPLGKAGATNVTGRNNFYSYTADLDPTDPASVLRILALSNQPPDRSVFFLSSSNRLYTLLWTTNLWDGQWTNVPDKADIRGSGTLTNLLDVGGAGQRFYRLGVRLP